MPKVNDKPEGLRAFLFHGLDLTWTSEDEGLARMKERRL
jgi:hypothetical protein